MNIMIKQDFWLFEPVGVIIIALSEILISLGYLRTGMDFMALFEIIRGSEIGGPGVQPFWRSTTLVVQILKKFSTQKYNFRCIDNGFKIFYTGRSQV
jgi:hypothetical protein